MGVPISCLAESEVPAQTATEGKFSEQEINSNSCETQEFIDLFEPFQKRTEEKVVCSKSKSSDVSHSLRDFDVLCLPLQTLISAFYIFYNFSPLLLPYILLLFWKTAFKLKGFFLYFLLPTFFPVKPENEQGRRTSLEKFTRSVVSSFSFPYSLSSELHF